MCGAILLKKEIIASMFERWSKDSSLLVSSIHHVAKVYIFTMRVYVLQQQSCKQAAWFQKHFQFSRLEGPPLPSV